MMSRGVAMLEMYDKYSTSNRQIPQTQKQPDQTQPSMPAPLANVLKCTRTDRNSVNRSNAASTAADVSNSSDAVPNSSDAVPSNAASVKPSREERVPAVPSLLWTPSDTVAFTGHRPEKLPWGDDENSPSALLYKFRLRETLEYLIGMGYINFLSGAARGFDTIAAEMVISLREVYPWIKLIMVLPCADQAKHWNEADQARWENIVLNSDHVETLQDTFTRSCMFKRNRYLVDHSSLLLACFNGDQHSGTAMTVNYAHQKKVKVRRLRLDKGA